MIKLKNLIKEVNDTEELPFAVFVLVPVNGGYASTTRAADRGESGKIGLPSGKVDPNEVVQVGYVSETGLIGSFICSIVYEPVPPNAYAGLTSIPIITDNTSSFTVTLGTGSVNLYNNSSGIGTITGYPLDEKTFSLPVSLTASFVYATLSGSNATYGITNDFNDINGTSVILVATLYITNYTNYRRLQ